MNTPSPSRWSELFDIAMSIIDHANGLGIDMHDWSFGGGTALMLQIGHRDSHDVDVFVSDAQYLAFLNPDIQGFDLSVAPSSYDTDGVRALKITFDGMGEIDFICCNPVTANSFESVTIQEHMTRRETPAEIIAKKIVFRGASLQPRDMFDIAAAARVCGEESIGNALMPFRGECAVALNVAQGMNPDFARSIMGNLMARPAFAELHLTAQDECIRVLESVVRTSTY